MQSKSKGFTLLELLVVSLFLSSFVLMALPFETKIEDDYHLFLNNYLLTKKDALINQEELILECDNAPYELIFSKNGNIKQAQTISFKRHKVVIRVGYGSIYYE